MLRRGITIIELLVVMALIGVMAGMVVPRLRVSPNQKVRIAARLLLKDVETARNRALALKRVTRLQFTTGTSQYVTYADDNADGAIAATNAEILYARAFGTRQLENGIVFGRGAAPNVPGESGSGAVTFGSTRIDFDARGLPTPFGTKGTIYLTTSADNSFVYAVQMSGAGSLRLWTYKAATSTWQ